MAGAGEGVTGQVRRRCALCERHQRLETVEGTVFWMEYGDDGRPRLCLDTRSQGGGLNVICVGFCPLCGRACETMDEEERHGQETEYPGVQPGECGQTDAEKVPGQ